MSPDVAADRPRRRRRLGLPLALIALAALLAAAAVWKARRDREFDPTFNLRVRDPAFATARPRLLFDEGHRNVHSAALGYRPFVELARSDGFDVASTSEPLSATQLAGVAVLAVVGARGANDANDDPAFSGAEESAIEEWVRGGGALLLVTDHWPFGAAMAPLALRFGVRIGQGMVEDPAHQAPKRGASHLVFSRDNGLLSEHPITAGRSAAERLGRVMTFTGTSLQGPPGAVAFLELADSAVEYPPTRPTVTHDGGDVRVDMSYGEPRPLHGAAQGLAFEHGSGRVVVLGEAGMLRAARDESGRSVGMNVADFDNRQLALNLLRWLARAI